MALPSVEQSGEPRTESFAGIQALQLCRNLLKERGGGLGSCSPDSPKAQQRQENLLAPGVPETLLLGAPSCMTNSAKSHWVTGLAAWEAQGCHWCPSVGPLL